MFLGSDLLPHPSMMGISTTRNKSLRINCLQSRVIGKFAQRRDLGAKVTYITPFSWNTDSQV
jgi:hypothetical protein